MWSTTQKKVLNVIILLALALLVGVSFTAFQRNQAQIAYDTLAEKRAAQELEEAARSLTDAALAYQYVENKNKEWLDINPDFVGWVRLSGTRIDYPAVRGNDNQEYLDKDFNGRASAGGSIFMDYRNLGNFNDTHTIFYGHTMKNKTMFHDLVYFHDPAFFRENSLIQLAGLYETKNFKIFSVYEISADDYAFRLEFENTNDYASYLDQLIALSMHTSDITMDADLGLLTLVTCSYGVNNGRTVVHAIEVTPS